MLIKLVKRNNTFKKNLFPFLSVFCRIASFSHICFSIVKRKVSESFWFGIIMRHSSRISSYVQIVCYPAHFMLSSLILSLTWIIRLIEWSLLQLYCYWVRRVYLPRHYSHVRSFRPSISVSGGGQLWPYGVGVGHYLHTHYDLQSVRLFSSSCGCFATVPLALNESPVDWCKRDWSKCLEHFSSRSWLGCLFDSKQFYYDLWNNYLPEDAHIRCSGRLYLSITKLFPYPRNRIVSHYPTRNDLIETILASMCLPVIFLRSIVCTREGWSIDGGLTNDLPCCDSYTVTISSINYNADIFPKDRALGLLDVIRVPSLERVWQVARIGELDAAACPELQFEHWMNIKKADQIDQNIGDLSDMASNRRT